MLIRTKILLALMLLLCTVCICPPAILADDAIVLDEAAMLQMSDTELQALLKLHGESLLRKIRPIEKLKTQLEQEHQKRVREVDVLYQRLIESQNLKNYLIENRANVLRMTALEDELAELRKSPHRNGQAIQTKKLQLQALRDTQSVLQNEFDQLLDVEELNQAIYDTKIKEIQMIQAQLEKANTLILSITEADQVEMDKIRRVQQQNEKFYSYTWADKDSSCLKIDSRGGAATPVDPDFCIEKLGVTYQFSKGRCQKLTPKKFILQDNVSAFECIQMNREFYRWEKGPQGIFCYRYQLNSENFPQSNHIVLTERTARMMAGESLCEQSNPGQLRIKRIKNRAICVKEVSAALPPFIENQRAPSDTDSESTLTFATPFQLNECLKSADIGIEQLEAATKSNPKARFLSQVFQISPQVLANHMEDGDQPKLNGQLLQKVLLSAPLAQSIQRKEEKLSESKLLAKQQKYDHEANIEMRCQLLNEQKLVPPILHEHFKTFANDLFSALEQAHEQRLGNRDRLVELSTKFRSTDPVAVAKGLDTAIEDYLKDSGAFLSFDEKVNHLRTYFPEQYRNIQCQESWGPQAVICQLLVKQTQEAFLQIIKKTIHPLLKDRVDPAQVDKDLMTIIELRRQAGPERKEEYLLDTHGQCWLLVNEMKYYPADAALCPNQPDSKMKNFFKKLF